MTFRSRHLLDLARGQDCKVNGPTCNRNPETTVTAHNPFGERGTGIKCADWDSCWACSDCHDFLDGRAKYGNVGPEIRSWHFVRARAETQAAMWEQGLISVTGHTPREKAPARLKKVLDRTPPAWKGAA